MPESTIEPSGVFVDDLPSGKSATFAAPPASDRNEGGVSEPQSYGGFDAFDPRTIPIDSPTDTGEPRRTKSGAVDGRTLRGKRGAKKEESGLQNLIDLSGVLLTIHSMLAALTGVSELEMEESEAKSLSEALKTVAKFHDVPISPKTLAHINLAGVLVEIYGTRVMAYGVRTKKEKPDRPAAPGPQKVTTMDKAAKPFEWTPPTDAAPSQIWKEPAL